MPSKLDRATEQPRAVEQALRIHGAAGEMQQKAHEASNSENPNDPEGREKRVTTTADSPSGNMHYERMRINCFDRRDVEGIVLDLALEDICPSALAESAHNGNAVLKRNR